MDLSYIYRSMVQYYSCEFLLSTRKREVADKKKIFVYLSRKYTQATYQEIAEYLGYHNHTTVLAAHRGCETLKIYPNFANDIAHLEKIIMDDIDFVQCVGELKYSL